MTTVCPVVQGYGQEHCALGYPHKGIHVFPSNISHDQLCQIVNTMLDAGRPAEEIVYAVEKPWKFLELLDDAAPDQIRARDYLA